MLLSDPASRLSICWKILLKFSERCLRWRNDQYHDVSDHQFCTCLISSFRCLNNWTPFIPKTPRLTRLGPQPGLHYHHHNLQDWHCGTLTLYSHIENHLTHTHTHTVTCVLRHIMNSVVSQRFTKSVNPLITRVTYLNLFLALKVHCDSYVNFRITWDLTFHGFVFQKHP